MDSSLHNFIMTAEEDEQRRKVAPPIHQAQAVAGEWENKRQFYTKLLHHGTMQTTFFFFLIVSVCAVQFEHI